MTCCGLAYGLYSPDHIEETREVFFEYTGEAIDEFGEAIKETEDAPTKEIQLAFYPLTGPCIIAGATLISGGLVMLNGYFNRQAREREARLAAARGDRRRAYSLDPEGYIGGVYNLILLSEKEEQCLSLSDHMIYVQEHLLKYIEKKEQEEKKQKAERERARYWRENFDRINERQWRNVRAHRMKKFLRRQSGRGNGGSGSNDYESRTTSQQRSEAMNYHLDDHIARTHERVEQSDPDHYFWSETITSPPVPPPIPFPHLN